VTGGQPILPYLRALQVDLFLSKEEQAVREALQAGFSAGLIFGGPAQVAQSGSAPVIALDGDAVLFSDEADRIFREKGLSAFAESEVANASVPMQAGPLHRFARALSELQGDQTIDAPPFRIALVTARDLTFCERPIQSLRAWGIRIDQAFFLGDMSKGIMLAALKPLAFLDDSEKHCADAAASTPTFQVPLIPEGVPPNIEPPIALEGNIPAYDDMRPRRFASACRLFLKGDFERHEQALREWHEDNLRTLTEEKFDAMIAELQRSAQGAPRGLQRRSGKADNTSFSKLLLFLESLLRKHAGH
jgi:hypothetical protein